MLMQLFDYEYFVKNKHDACFYLFTLQEIFYI